MSVLLTTLFSAVVFLWIKVWQMNHELSTLRSMVVKELSKKKPQQQSLPPQSQEHSKPLHCSFCGKTQHEVKKLIAGPNVYVCDECISLCNEIITKDNQKEKSAGLPSN